MTPTSSTRVPDGAVRLHAAALALRDGRWGGRRTPSFVDMARLDRDRYEDQARRDLEAAYPVIRDQIHREVGERLQAEADKRRGFKEGRDPEVARVWEEYAVAIENAASAALDSASPQEGEGANVLSRMEARLVVEALLPAVSGTESARLADRLSDFAFPDDDGPYQPHPATVPGGQYMPPDARPDSAGLPEFGELPQPPSQEGEPDQPEEEKRSEPEWPELTLERRRGSSNPGAVRIFSGPSGFDHEKTELCRYVPATQPVPSSLGGREGCQEHGGADCEECFLDALAPTQPPEQDRLAGEEAKTEKWVARYNEANESAERMKANWLEAEKTAEKAEQRLAQFQAALLGEADRLEGLQNEGHTLGYVLGEVHEVTKTLRRLSLTKAKEATSDA